MCWEHSRRDAVAPYITLDGSEIRELMRPQPQNSCQKQSLAEATVKPGCTTRLHRHLRSEELYHILSGSGQMSLADATFAVGPGDTICIAAGTAHCIKNSGSGDLVLLCCCAPAYSHEDTELL